MSDVEMRRREMKTKLLASRGIEVSKCSADEWLALALQAEATARSMSPFDPSRVYFIQRERDYIDAAALREHVQPTSQDS